MACRWTEKARSKDDNQSITSISGLPSKGASSRVGREVSMAQYRGGTGQRGLSRMTGRTCIWKGSLAGAFEEFCDENSECCSMAQKVGLGLSLF